MGGGKLKVDKWLFAIIQHPMVLAVHEDRGVPVIGERTLPWGAPDIYEYADRVRRNLAALTKHPDMKLNYEFSGVELEILAVHAPDIIPCMRDMIAQHRLAFTGGDYSQPHGQLYSGELNYRQLEFGQRVLNEIVGYRVTSFFHQETWLHDQMPQLLRAFRFRTAAIPLFPHTLTPLSDSRGPNLVGCDYHTYAPVKSDSIASWRGLDGTEIPLLVTGIVRAGLDRTAVIQEDHKGLYRSSDFVVIAPDMDEIRDEDFTFIQQYGKTVLFDEALEATVHQQTPTWKTRLTTYWSYSEGEWAEAVTRQIRRSEVILLAEEAMATVHGKVIQTDAEADWKTVLAAMHHDVHWLEITDLKRIYLARMQEVETRAQYRIAKIIGALAESGTDTQWIRVVNPLPYARQEIVYLKRSKRLVHDVFSSDGKKLQSQCIPSMDTDGVEVLFSVQLSSLGVADFQIVEGTSPVTQGKICDTTTVAVGQHTMVVEADGTVKEIVVYGDNVLSGSGHDLHYLDSQGKPIGGSGREGRMISFQGEVADVIRISAPIGDVRTEIEYTASRAQPFFTVNTCFHFCDNAIGVEWRDWTKLNSYWPTNGDSIRHDIAYGVVDGAESVPLHAPSWLSVRDGRNGRGLAILNTGTPKHWVDEGVIGCVLAWGGRKHSWVGEDFSSRRDVNVNPGIGPFDLSLKGTQTIRHGVLPLISTLSEVEIARTAQRLNSPLLIYGIPDKHDSEAQGDALDLSATDLIGTAVFLKEKRLAYRFYEGAGSTHSVDVLTRALGCELEITDLAGDLLDVVTPYRIGCLTAKL